MLISEHSDTQRDYMDNDNFGIDFSKILFGNGLITIYVIKALINKHVNKRNTYIDNIKLVTKNILLRRAIKCFSLLHLRLFLIIIRA
jgi:hypothetical protein